MSDVKRTPAEQEAILNAKVRMDGIGEDPPVQAVLSDDFINASDQEALDRVLPLQQLVRGLDSILSKLEQSDERTQKALQQMRERMDAYEKVADRWETDREKLLTEIREAGDKLLMSPEEREKLQARVVQEQQREVQKAMAAARMSRTSFKQQIMQEPRESVIDPGEVITYRERGQLKSKIVDRVIRIRGVSIRIPAGKPTEIPVTFATRLREIRAEQEETEARKRLLSAEGGLKGEDKKDTNMAANWDSINREYGSPSSAIPIASNA